jgi:hypothetical protein
MIKPHRDITIKQSVNGGWIVRIGCVELPYSDKKAMLKTIAKYISSPDKLESEYDTKNQESAPLSGQNHSLFLKTIERR